MTSLSDLIVIRSSIDDAHRNAQRLGMDELAAKLHELGVEVLCMALRQMKADVAGKEAVK